MKRIFSPKQDPPPVTELGRTPSCYYHKLPITHFCVKKKCTLPLCQQCLPIHKREHINNKQIPNEGIIEFENARQDALDAFEERKQQITAAQNKFRNKIEEYRSKMLETIDNILDKFCQDSLITDGNLEIIGQINERTAEIKRGSLKEIIRYYEDIYGAEHFRKLYKMYSGQFLSNFKYDFDKKGLENIVKVGIKNLNYKSKSNEEHQKQHHKSDPKTNKINEQPTHKVFDKKQLDTHQPVNKQNYLINKRESFNEDDQSQISSYQLLKTKKSTVPSIYTHNSRVHQPYQNIPSNNNSSQVSRSKSKKKKGLSLTKFHSEVSNSSNLNSFERINTEPVEKIEENQVRKPNWRKFVNMGVPHQQNQQSIKIEEPNTVLNPKQMRQLIIKKKNDEKQKAELRSNKSSENLISNNERIIRNI